MTTPAGCTTESPPATAERPRRPSWFARIFLQEDLNFLLTNRLPRRWLTIAVGRFSKIRSRWLTRVSLWVWKRFASDLDLSEAAETDFPSLHAAFTRRLKPGARAFDPDPTVVTTPCDGIVGAHGRIDGTEVFQAKGFPYPLEDLLPDPELVAKHRDGLFVTIRLTSSMYHRFHAPCDGALRRVTYVSGDTWNVNPLALRRVEKLFCKNERAVLDLELPGDGGQALTLVPVAAILVAGIRLNCLPEVLDLRYRGPNELRCDAEFGKGDELGYFQHGSTILLFASGGFEFAEGIREGGVVRAGQPLFRGRHVSSTAPRPDPVSDPSTSYDDR